MSKRVKSVKVTGMIGDNEQTVHDFSEVFASLFDYDLVRDGDAQHLYMTGYYNSTHTPLHTDNHTELTPLMEEWGDWYAGTTGDTLGWHYDVSAGAYLVATWDGNDLRQWMVREDGEDHWEFGAVLEQLELSFEVEWEEDEPADDDPPMFHPSLWSAPSDEGDPRHVDFYHEGGVLTGQLMFGISAGMSTVVKDVPSVFINTEDGPGGRIRIVLNDVPIYDANPETGSKYPLD